VAACSELMTTSPFSLLLPPFVSSCT
jgi:hypothetical protein